jgi:hypothetical protein
MNVQKPLPARVVFGPESPVGAQTPLPTAKSNCLGCHESVPSAKNLRCQRCCCQIPRRVHVLINQRQQGVHADKSAEELRVRDPNHTGYVRVSEGIEVGRTNFVAGRAVQLVGPVEVIVVADINPGGGSEAPLMP